uniref:NADH-ubiquinone oxidoreductase chain 2 n=1 Tax=Chrysomeloidea sp. 8 KM-2017 TaxID=2219302 RepID=A0A346RJ74_9CUCU|nr:NADH dehydrogenase subunit 2 [Chrysomeloidea sp. 8 KM-2017]
MLKSFKIVFFLTTIMGTLITISANSWMSMWMGLEINLLSILPLLSSNNQANSIEASIKYFITQVLASNIILMSILCTFNFNSQIDQMPAMFKILQSAIFLKMGAAPFHSWFPEVLEGLSWMNCLMILTWQKIAPMIILMNSIKQEMFIYSIMIMSMLIGGILGFNQMSIRKIMAYSSINHVGWMIAAMMSTKTLWITYFCIYFVISLNIILIMNQMNVKNISQLTMLFKQTKFMGLIFSMNFLSLGGLPPFLGFFPKWLAIQQMLVMNEMALALIMIILTLVATFFYLRLSLVPMMMANKVDLGKNSMKMNFYLALSNYLSIISLITCAILLNPM